MCIVWYVVWCIECVLFGVEFVGVGVDLEGGWYLVSCLLLKKRLVGKLVVFCMVLN